MCNQKKEPGAGFTLVELLVVVALIAVLAALLLPSLKSARDRSRTVKCVNNEREIAAGFSGYTSDNNGYYPYINPENPLPKAFPGPNSVGIKCIQGRPWRRYSGMSYFQWFDAIAPYMGGSVGMSFRCPANPWSPGVSYKMNMNLFPGSWRDAQQSTGGACCLPNSPKGWSSRRRMGSILHPSQGLLVGECPTSRTGEDPWTKVTGGNLPSVVANYGFYALQPLYVTNVFAYAGSGLRFDWVLPECNSYVSTFHNLGMNSLLVDGHVDWTSKKTLIAYCVDTINPVAVNYEINSPGHMYWNDGRPIGVYNDQFPSEDLPYDGLPVQPCAPDWDP